MGGSIIGAAASWQQWMLPVSALLELPLFTALNQVFNLLELVSPLSFVLKLSSASTLAW